MKKTLTQLYIVRLLCLAIVIFIASYSNAQGDNCSDAIDLCTITSPYSSTTTGKSSDFSFCSMGGSVDMIFYVDLPDGETLTIGQSSNSYDSRHSLRYGGACPGSNEIVCRDDPDTQTETWTNNTGSLQRVYWIQAGYSSGNGPYTLAWSVTAGCITSCDDPTSLSVANVNPESANLLWSDPGTGSSWNIEYGTAGFSPTGTPTISNVNSTTYQLYGLSAATSYEYYVQSDCGSLNSNWVGPFPFTTPSCDVQNISSLSTSPFYNGVSISWTENGNATVWDIELGPAGFAPTGTPTANNITNNPYTYSGLASTTSYDVYVRSQCGGTNSSWVGPVTFTTTDFPNNYVTEMIDGWARGVVQDPNGDYVWAGYSSPNSTDFQVVKTDQAGVLIWTYVYGGTGSDMAFDIVNSGDGGYVIVGHTSSAELVASSSTDLMVTKLNSAGNEVWTTVIGTSASEYSSPCSIIRNPDGTFSIASTSNNDFHFVHLDANGGVLKTKILNTQSAWGNALTKCKGINSGWLVGGRYQGPLGSEFMVTKIKEDGTYDWSMVWGDGTGTGEVIYAMVENGPNDYTVFGYTYAEGTTPQNMYATRFTNNGGGANVVWIKAYGQTSSCSLNDARITADGNYIITGSCAASNGMGTYSDTYLVKINPSNGEIIWQTEKPDDGTGNRQGNGVYEDAAGSFLVAGLGGFDMLKFGPNGEICDGIPGVLVTNDLGNSLPNLDYTEGTSNNTFGVSSATRTLVRQNYGTMLTGCIIVVLPTELSSFQSDCLENGTLLSWTTDTEKNNAYFILEKSTNGIDFFELDRITAIGNSTTPSNYHYIDNRQSNGIAYYQLKMVNLNGEITSLEVITATCNLPTYSVFPNPFNESFSINLSSIKSDIVDITMIDYVGKIVLNETYKIESGIVKVTPNKQLANGVYLIKIKDDSERVISFKLMKI